MTPKAQTTFVIAMPSVVDYGRALNFSAQTVEEKAVIGIAVKDHTSYQIEKAAESHFVLTDPNSNFKPLEVSENIDFLDKGLQGVYVDPHLGYEHSAFEDARAMIDQINDILMDSRVMHDWSNDWPGVQENGGVVHYHYKHTEDYYYHNSDGELVREIEITEHGDGTRTKATTEYQGWDAGTTTTETQVQTEDGSWETISEEDNGFWSWLTGLFDCFPVPPPPYHFDGNGEGQDGMILTEMQALTPIESIKFNLV